MSENRGVLKRTVRRASSFKMPVVVYIVVFAAISAGAYWWGLVGNPVAASHKEFTANASIHLRSTETSAATPNLDPKSVRQQMLSKATVDRAASQIQTAMSSGGDAAAVATDMEQMIRLQQKLAVAVVSNKTPGDARIQLTYRDDNPRNVVLWVNGLADSFAEGYRQQWRSRADTTYNGAHDAAVRAAEELRQATARLDSFVEQQMQQVRPAPQATHAPAANASLVDNPAWLDLNRQIGELQQRVAQLLINRTPIHPEVREAQGRLADMQRRLMETQRWIPGRQTGAATPATIASESLAAAQTTISRGADAVEALKKLKEAVQQATGANDAATRTEREALQARQQEPQIDLELAQMKAAPPSLPTPLRLALAAIAAGLTTTVGLGMIATGATIEPTVNSLAQVNAVLTVPVIGVVPETNRLNTARSSRSTLLRMLWIATGSIVVVSCVAAMLLSGR